MILVVFSWQSAGFCRPGVLAGTPAFAWKHFPRVWQLEQNKRLLFASCCSTSHNTQLTACNVDSQPRAGSVWDQRQYKNMASSAFYPFANLIEDKMSLKSMFGLCRQVEGHTCLSAPPLSKQPLWVVSRCCQCRPDYNPNIYICWYLMEKKMLVITLGVRFNQWKNPLASCDIPFPHEGLGQTLRPPMTRRWCL